jgi:hypothetical protein
MGDFWKMLKTHEASAPLKRNREVLDVAKSAL